VKDRTLRRHIERVEDLERLLVERVADIVMLPPHAIDPEAPHADHGLDSASAVLLTADLEDELGVALSPSLAWDHPSLRAIAAHVFSLMATEGGA
jgi:acyl carrier protein